ncbi:MAG TPA: class I adenylate-forming enzyme family protein [Acidimicrobiales bacterium]|nr:class I adenylate-forming enzyme family protein [Acidimicrobiales bacterium]
MNSPSVPFSPTMGNLLRHAEQRFAAGDYVVTQDKRLTFESAEVQSRRLAKRLLKAGVGKGTRIGVLFPQGPDFVTALLAITRVGGVAVLLSTFLRPPELARAVRHADLDTLIAPRSLLGQDLYEQFEITWPELRNTQGRTLYLTEAPYLRRIWLVSGADRPWATATPELDSLADEGDVSDAIFEQIEAEVRPSDLMVMIHTSGATADPKAVVHTHGAQIRHAWSLAQLYGFTEDVRTFTTMPFFWVGGLTVCLLSHLHVGAAVLTVERMDPPAMLELIERERATRIVGWTLLDRITADPVLADRDLSWLVELDASGSAPDPGLRHNSLGMSETGGPHTAAAAAEKDVDLPERLRGSFGPPVPGVQHKVVDPENPSVALPEGVEGDLLVRGYSLMDGLYKKERSETFDEDGWYRTGDKGFFRDSYLFFTGRSTEMIKTGGANVAPREVELVLESLPGVQAAFVVGLPDAKRGQLVGCLVCPEPNTEIVPTELTEQLRTLLSTYKIPRVVKVVPYEEAPWLPSGKISKPRVIDLLSKTSDDR